MSFTDESYDVVVERYQRLVIDLHIPLLDHKLYHKYLVTPTPRTTPMYTKLTRLVTALTEHKGRTLKVLRMIQTEREEYHGLRAVVARYASGELTTLEVQTLALNILHNLQRTLMAIVEGIEEWRSACTRPYAFIFEGENFLLTVLKEYRELELSALYTALPISFSQYPMLSNVPSLSLFRGGTSQLPTYPLKRRAETASNSSVMSSSRSIARLRRAESVLRGEPRRQIRLLHELTQLGLEGNFVPILIVARELLPQGELGCEKGVHIQSEVLMERLNATLHASWEGVVKLQKELNMQEEPEGEDADAMSS